MTTKLFWGIAAAAILASAMAGYRIGADTWPFTASKDAFHARAIAAGKSERKVLYWKDPNGQNEFSAAPKQTVDGHAYLPVYEDQEPGFAEPKAEQAKADRKIIYYRNPMGLADTSPTPKKDWMGMDYIPVYDGDDEGTTVKVSLDRVQRAGVRTQAVAMRVMERAIRVAGVVKPDERTLRAVTLRADGFLEKLYVNTTGQHVTAGEPLFRVYSPQMVSAQVDYRSAATAPGAGARDKQGALQRLKNLDVPDAVLKQLQTSPDPAMSIDWPAPVSGVVMQKMVVEGQMVKAGEEMFRLADLGRVWVIADVGEDAIGAIKTGAPAKISFRAFPGETFQGTVSFILHELEPATRTAKVRIEVANPEHRIKHEMYADVEIDAGAGDASRLVVPVSAVLDTGDRQVVLVEKGEGRFEPRPVKPGLRGDGFIEIREGLTEGESVVVTANFLIDAESNLKAALQAFTAEPAAQAETR